MIDVPARIKFIGLALAIKFAPDYEKEAETIAGLLIGRESCEQVVFGDDGAHRFDICGKLGKGAA